MNKKISFQGVEGAYSHLAVQEFFPGAEPLPCKTFEIALNEAELGNVDYAMIPIENSAAGRVADIHRLIPKSNLHINFEHFQKVEHKLLIHPDSKIENIKNIISHEQALAQCSDKIQKLDLDILIGADTAGSAKKIFDEKIYDTAAIASSLAGSIYGLKVIETNNVNMIKLESYNYGADFVITQFYCEIEGHPDQENTKFALDDMDHYCSKVRKLGVFEKSPYRVRQ